MDRANACYEKLRVSHESLLGATKSMVTSVIKSLKKEADPDIVLKEMESMKTVLEGL